jgi:hypothetical protein
MFKKNLLCTSFLLVILSVCLYAADLEVEESVYKFLDELTAQDQLIKADRNAETSISDLKAPERETIRPVIYEIIVPEKSHRYMTQLGRIVRNEGHVQTEIHYNTKTGMYHYFDESFTPLVQSDEQYLYILEQKAKAMLTRLMGNESGNFVFANTEDDYYCTPDHLDPILAARTYRFTRKINGRHIIDNTAYVSIRYSGNGQMTAFEIVNPVLKPLKLDSMVSQSAALSRLETYAENKKTAKKPGYEPVTVNLISVSKGIESYLSEQRGDKRYLVPHLSFWSTYSLENEDSYQRYINLSLDASTTPNLEDDAIEREEVIR